MQTLESGKRHIPAKLDNKPNSKPKPKRQLSKQGANRLATMILAVLTLAASAGVLAFITVVTNSNESANTTAGAAPSAVGWAEIAANEFIAGETLSVPRAAAVPAQPSDTVLEDASVVWAGFEDVFLLETALERHFFVLVRPGFEPVELSLLFNTSNAEYPILAAEPSIVELAPVLEAGERFDFNSLQQVPHTPALERRLAAWGQALATGDSVSLKNEILDPQASAVYRGVDGLTVIDVDVQTVVQLDEVHALVRATVDFQDPAAVQLAQEALADPNSLGGTTAVADAFEPPVITLAYDILVEDVSTEAPKIRAWGAPGSGTSLEPFSNAFISTQQSG